MGLFSFVKDAGKKLFGGEEVKAVSSHADQLEKMEAAKRLAIQKKFQGELATHGLAVEGLEVVLLGAGAVRVRGTVASQEVREKVVLAIGNVDGVASVDDELVVPKGAAPAEPPAVFYTVQKGDTLGKIAKQHYGSANLYPKIFEANKPMLKDPDKIYPGQSLRIPPK